MAREVGGLLRRLYGGHRWVQRACNAPHACNHDSHSFILLRVPRPARLRLLRRQHPLRVLCAVVWSTCRPGPGLLRQSPRLPQGWISSARSHRSSAAAHWTLLRRTSGVTSLLRPLQRRIVAVRPFAPRETSRARRVFFLSFCSSSPRAGT